ncbi:hypothetical protein GCM10008965_45900 [Methylorubrum aminovorans]
MSGAEGRFGDQTIRVGTAAPKFRRKQPFRAHRKRGREAVDSERGRRKCSPKFAEVWPQIREVQPQFSGILAPDLWSKPLPQNTNFYKDFLYRYLKET